MFGFYRLRTVVGALWLNEIHKAQLLQQWAVFVELSTTEQLLND